MCIISHWKISEKTLKLLSIDWSSNACSSWLPKWKTFLVLEESSLALEEQQRRYEGRWQEFRQDIRNQIRGQSDEMKQMFAEMRQLVLGARQQVRTSLFIVKVQQAQNWALLSGFYSFL